MAEYRLQNCPCCGLPLSVLNTEYCPRCQHPVSLDGEAATLAYALRHLPQIASNGGAGLTVAQLIPIYEGTRILRPVLHRLNAHGNGHLTVTELIERYEVRLQELRQEREAQIAITQAQPISTQETEMDHLVVTQDGAEALEQPHSIESASSGPASPTTVSTHNTVPQRTFSISSFFAEQTITLVALLGAFLILIGALSFIVNVAHDPTRTFVVVFAVDSVFGLIGMITYRLPSIRLIARIYTIIYALLIPLLGYTGFELVQGHMLHLPGSAFLLLAALYAASAYGLLTVLQRFRPFSYPAILALLLADLAVAQSLGLSYFWWPAFLMVPALPALTALLHPSQQVAFHLERIFTGPLALFRGAVRILMSCIVALCVASALVTFLSALIFVPIDREIRFALLAQLLLLLIWTVLSLWVRKQTRSVSLVAYQGVACLLALCYALDLRPVGYVCALAGCALLYHGLSRFGAKLLSPLAPLRLRLDQLALLFVGVAPVISMPHLPFQLLVHVHLPSPIVPSPFLLNWEMVVELAALGVGILLTLAITLQYTHLKAHASSPKSRNGWPWLVLLSGLLLNWGYGATVLLLHAPVVGSFLAATIVLVACLLLLGRLPAAKQWVNPLALLTLCEALLTLVLDLADMRSTMSLLLLVFAGLAYVVVLYQRRLEWLFVPFIFILLALLPLLNFHREFLLLLCMFLPLCSALVQRVMNWKIRFWRKDASSSERSLPPWEWPLMMNGIVYAGTFTYKVFVSPTGWSIARPELALPVALSLAVLALSWYASALFVRRHMALVVAFVVAIAALIVPTNNFWVLSCIVPVAIILYIAIKRLLHRFADCQFWAVPWYALAVVSAVMVGKSGYVQGQLLPASWILVGIAIVFYMIGIIRNWFLWYWLTPIFGTWSAIYSGLLGDLPRLTVLTFSCAVLGLTISFAHVVTSLVLADDRRMLGAASQAAVLFRYSHETRRSAPPLSLIAFAAGVLLRLHGRSQLLKPYNRHYASPLYATALGATVVTGLFGLHVVVTAPFYKMVPLTLLTYAVVTYIVLLSERHFRELWHLIFIVVTAQPGQAMPKLVLEKRSGWIWLVTALALWAIGLEVQISFYYVVAIGLGAGLLALCVRPFLKARNRSASAPLYEPLHFWCSPWYLTALAAALVTASRPLLPLAQPERGFIVGSLFAFALLTLLTMFVERLPPLLTFVVALAGWALWLWPWPLWQVLIGYTLLCITVFGTQFLWREHMVPSGSTWASVTAPHRLFALVGQTLVVLTTLLHGAPFAGSQPLVQVGASSLLALTVLIFWDGQIGRIEPVRVRQRYCNYGAGLLLTCLLSWELAAFHLLPSMFLFLLAPASYLSIIAPSVMRDAIIPQHRQLGRLLSILGTALLLLPTLQASIGTSSSLPTLLLVAESLALLLLGIATRLRFFVLSGVSLVIVGALYSLFLPALGIPTPLALTGLGGILLCLATLLTLFRHQVQAVWAQWE